MPLHMCVHLCVSGTDVFDACMLGSVGIRNRLRGLQRGRQEGGRGEEEGRDGGAS